MYATLIFHLHLAHCFARLLSRQSPSLVPINLANVASLSASVREIPRALAPFSQIEFYQKHCHYTDYHYCNVLIISEEWFFASLCFRLVKEPTILANKDNSIMHMLS